ncbi:MAG TPA: imidazolonepropionase [Actinomycetota bacterium]|nr:imidazolonepropionase [Actinomycetota bacterium]
MIALRHIGRLFTSAERGVIEDAAIVFDGAIRWVGRDRDLPRGDAEELDAAGALVTPGFIDAHTHPVYPSPRLDEVAARARGTSYVDIAESGGGIAATVAATRASDADELATVVEERIARWAESGTTTVEAKTGYHLTRDGELAAVEILSSLAERDDLPRIEVTFLGAHAVPPGVSRSEHVDAVVSWCVEAGSAGARFCDVFCDDGYFTVDEARRILSAGRAARLAPRIHADELARTGGALLAAELDAASADHLLRITPEDAAALGRAGVTATLAPVTALAMGTIPPVEALRSNSVTIALGSDHNPGTSGLTDMTIVVALAVAELGLSVEEAVTAATRGGALSLLRRDLGVIEVGATADIVLWDADHEGAFAWQWGVAPVAVWREGRGLSF